MGRRDGRFTTGLLDGSSPGPLDFVLDACRRDFYLFSWQAECEGLNAALRRLRNMARPESPSLQLPRGLQPACSPPLPATALFLRPSGAHDAGFQPVHLRCEVRGPERL